MDTDGSYSRATQLDGRLLVRSNGDSDRSGPSQIVPVALRANQVTCHRNPAADESAHRLRLQWK